MKNPAISVVMPAYQAAPFLREAVESILRQTERDFELILINDGSKDGTHAIAQELCAQDGRIRYFTQDNRGVVATLNRGLELAQGEFIARMDSDDVAHPQRFEKQLALLRSKHEVIVCGTQAVLFGAATGPWVLPRSDRACRARQLLQPCFVHPSVMFRRSAIDRGARYRADCLHAEDYDFWFQLGALGRMENLDEPLLFYRVHGGQVTNTKREAQRATHVAIASARLAEEGIAIEGARLHDLLWPELAGRSRAAILSTACWLSARLALKGRFDAALMLPMAAHILRHKRARAAA